MISIILNALGPPQSSGTVLQHIIKLYCKYTLSCFFVSKELLCNNLWNYCLPSPQISTNDKFLIRFYWKYWLYLDYCLTHCVPLFLWKGLSTCCPMLIFDLFCKYQRLTFVNLLIPTSQWKKFLVLNNFCRLLGQTSV